MPTTSIAPWPVIARPMEAPAVRALQHLLRFHGQAVTADGIFGPVTWRALVNNGC
jgi:peptidoglycan hydrolase-like protein with peptidoglycan-binding domain